MGNCGNSEVPVVDRNPDDNIGLSRREKRLIKDLWYHVNNKKAFMDNGSKFFIMLFREYPYIRKYFCEFNNISNEDVKLNYSLRAHGIAVFTAIAIYIDCMDDPPVLRAMIYKRTGRHHSKMITFEDMENLRCCLTKFFKEQCRMSRNKEASIAAMDKLLAFHNELYKTRIEEIVHRENERKERLMLPSSLTKRGKQPRDKLPKHGSQL